MMRCKGIINPPTKEHEAAIKRLNELAHSSPDKEWRADLYLKAFLDAVQIGAIREFTVEGTTYEVYADIMETSE